MTQATDIITLDEAKTFLNITKSDDDDKLEDFISAASQMWVRKVGSVAGSPTYDEYYSGGGSTIMLRNAPVQSVSVITESYDSSLAYTLTAEPLDGSGMGGTYGYTIDKTSGLLVRRANGIAVSFATGNNNVHVVYVAGYAVVPDDIKHAVCLLLLHMWQTQRGGTKAPGSNAMASGGTPASTSFTWPRRVQEIAAAYYVPGIA